MTDLLVPMPVTLPPDLYNRLDRARARQSPHASTDAFIVWLLGVALKDYEDAEGRVFDKLWQRLDATRLVDAPPSHQLHVR